MMMMEVEQRSDQISAPGVLTALLNEFSAITDHRILRDSLPRRLASLLECRCVLLYQRLGETLQFASGSFDDKPGWSSALLAVAHINPINLSSSVPEALACQERHMVYCPERDPTFVAMPLIYRQRSTGVLVALRGGDAGKASYLDCWQPTELQVLDAVAGVVALLLENTRLLERDRERIHELSLLNSLGSQMNYSLYEPERMRSVVMQRVREVTSCDLCELVEVSVSPKGVSWLKPSFCELLLQDFQEQETLVPLICERPGGLNHPHITEYLKLLPANIKTFFAIPLLSSRIKGWHGSSVGRSCPGGVLDYAQRSRVIGIIVGGFYHPWKLRPEEMALLQVLASQVSAVLENMYLMTEVVEARNEARKLLRQVLDDQRLKEKILESIPSGLITTDRDGCITTFNRAAEVMLGYRPCEVMGQPLTKLLDLPPNLCSSGMGGTEPLHNKSHAIIRQVIQGRQVCSGTVFASGSDDRELVLDIDLQPLCNEPDKCIGLLATFTDVTSMHRLEEEKRRLDRLASLGEMAANVAHEVRNPLASIKTSMQMLLEDLTDQERPTALPVQSVLQADEAQESVEVVLKEVERLDTIVRDLLLFARPRQLHRVWCDLSEVSDRVLRFIQPQCIEANVIVHRVYEDIPQLWLDIGQLEQVLLNLYINAVQAMPGGGILTVACRSIPIESAMHETGNAQCKFSYRPSNDVCVRPGDPEATDVAFQEQQWVELMISDTGVGIATDQLDRIFQPFYTTKAHGIGLGLAITRRLVEDHGGYIRVEGHYGYGATVSVRIPLVFDSIRNGGSEERAGEVLQYESGDSDH